MRKLLLTAFALGGALAALLAQDNPIGIGTITGGEPPAIAIPDLRGSGDAQAFMGAFNDTLRADVASASVFKVVAKSLYPGFVPQQPSDFVQPPPVQEVPAKRGQQLTQPATGGGRWL